MFKKKIILIYIFLFYISYWETQTSFLLIFINKKKYERNFI